MSKYLTVNARVAYLIQFINNYTVKLDLLLFQGFVWHDMEMRKYGKVVG